MQDAPQPPPQSQRPAKPMVVARGMVGVNETAAVRGEGGVDCDFCVPDRFSSATLFIASETVFFASDAFGPTAVLPGGGIISPWAHRETPFELTETEWSETQDLLCDAKRALDERLRPDGYNLIWNVKPDAGQEVAHVHLHLIPRFHDEPFAGHGARWHLKQPDNRRPDPLAPGAGRALRWALTADPKDGRGGSRVAGSWRSRPCG